MQCDASARSSLERLDVATRGIWPSIESGDHAAIDRLVKVEDRRSRLLGLDAPVRAELTGSGGGPIEVAAKSALDTKLDELAKRLILPPDQQSLAERLALDPIARDAFVAGLSDEEKAFLEYEWDRFWAHPKQVAPPGDWRYWLVLAGRGFGKTRCGSQWVCQRAKDNPRARIALVAETAADARDVMVEGDSGILSVSPPWFMPRYEPSQAPVDMAQRRARNDVQRGDTEAAPRPAAHRCVGR
jgi:hypothetical protein